MFPNDESDEFQGNPVGEVRLDVGKQGIDKENHPHVL
jgi:hypothetical protein